MIIKIKKSRKSRKGQIKIQEMAFVLLAVVFLFGILLLFFARFQMTSIQKSAEEIRESRAITMLQVIAALPELRCSKSFGTTAGIACIDKDKVLAFETPGIRNSYSKLWQAANIAKITIEEVFPEGKSYIIYQKSTQKSIITHSTFTPLCEETTAGSSCVIAKIKITIIVP